MPTFDLRTEKWIPVVYADGKMGELNLIDTLRDAHRLREIRDPFPIVEFGLYRLLVAIVMDMHGLKNTKQWEDLLEKRQFDATRIETYFTDGKEQFDLFHPKYPFLQAADMANEADKPLAGLLPPIPSGTNAAHFHHAPENAFAVCPAAAARLLTTLAPFMTAGGAGLSPSINGSPPWYALLTGETLFETLCLNCCYVPLPQGNDGEPAWHRKKPLLAERRERATLLEGLTWQPRRILLVPGAGGLCTLTCRESPVLVRAMKFSAGASSGFAWTDPNVPYRTTKDGKLVQRPQEGREVWRDIGPLALLQDKNYGKDEDKIKFSRPRLIDQFAALARDATDLLSGTHLRLTLYGMRTDLKMKVFEWQREALAPLRKPLILEQTFHRIAQQEMERASSVEYALRQAIKQAYPREGKGNKKAFDTLIVHTQREFWARLKDEYFDLLDDIAPFDPEAQASEIETRRQEWLKNLRSIGRDALNKALDALDANAEQILRAQVEARNTFEKATYFLFETQEQRTAREARKKTGKQATSTP